MQPTVALSFLNSELGMVDLDAGNAPTDLPAEITAILPDLNEAFRKAGVSSYEAPLLVREALELGPEAIHTIFPNFIKLMGETADFREKINTSFGMVNATINERGIDALHFYEDEFRAILLPENKLDEGETGRRLDRFAMKQYAANKHYELIKVFLEEIRDEERGDAKPPEPDTYPSTADRIKNRGLDKYFDELGIPEGLRTKLFDAWMSYSAIGHALRQYEKSQVKDLTDEEIEMASLQAARIFYEQLTAMQHYCEQYGSAELIELNEIFGIVDFTRGSAEQFHDQLLRWRNPELSVKNINLAATEDHNFAFGNTANLFFTSFGEDGSFYFEASSIPELSRAFVQVGTRERNAGREPIENSEVRNVVISGHGGPKGIALSRGNSVNIENFAQAAQGRHQLIDRHGNARPNDYSQHIGMSYRVILHACSAGKEVPESINLSQVLHREYGVPIEASSRVMAGYRVSEAGNIMYRVPSENGEYVYSDGVRYE